MSINARRKGSACQGPITYVYLRLPSFVSTLCLLENIVADTIFVIEAPQNLMQLHTPATAAASSSSSRKELAD